MAGLKLGIPAKGRLRLAAVDWLGSVGLTVIPADSDREYAGHLSGDSRIEPVFLPASEIPGELDAGQLHLGVTGQDLIRERLPFRTTRVAELLPLGFGFAELVIAVPDAWADVVSVDDLDAVAGAFRNVHGRPLRIATKYHNLVRSFLAERELADYRLVDSQGATEATVRNLTAEAIADITATGQTLRANHLRILDDGMILSSQAVLAASHSAPWRGDDRSTLLGLADRAGFSLPVGLGT
ncbi:MAG: ATP phosphoribosyltransferase [Paracoccaceae bacterium]|nr:ATP phosphoribosyltransferase [Paracoccaceae bacterium]MDE2911431.1 ATP phosphoribosyltransferase [Paracoccaceae bacterium]